ncbi:uncharacterized protein [Palaemon carinicauda]|uniref:uncharacterized protein n=1 Tax=Palaemon carinicauda TaxID=392227 RepID=UPI0035B5B643
MTSITRLQCAANGPPQEVNFLFALLGTGVRFLVDTGAYCSHLPKSRSRTRRSHSKHSDVILVAANGSEISTQRYVTLTLSFGSIKYHGKFLVADVTLPLLGADFLARFHLDDVRYRHLVNADSYSSTPLQPTTSDISSMKASTHPSYIQNFAKRPWFFERTGSPVFARFRRLTATKQTFVELK